MESVKRSYTLDSIKFFSMVIVYLCHLKMSFFPEKDVSLSIANLSIPNYLFNGNLAVCMFILISVYLSAEKAFNKELNNQEIVLTMIKRYLRLFIPAFIVNIVILLMYYLGLFYNLVYQTDAQFINSWFSFGTGIKPVLLFVYSTIELCFFGTGYNPPLWCYNLLFFLPIIEMILVVILKQVNKKFVLFLSLGLSLVCLLNNSYFSILFIVLGLFLIPNTSKSNNLLLVIAIIVFCIIFSVDVIKNQFKFDLINKFSVSCNILLATSLFEVIMKIGGIFNRKIFSIINSISFSIYLLHMPIICSLGFFLITRGGV